MEPSRGTLSEAKADGESHHVSKGWTESPQRGTEQDTRDEV